MQTLIAVDELTALERLRDTISLHLGTTDPEKVGAWITEARQLAADFARLSVAGRIRPFPTDGAVRSR